MRALRRLSIALLAYAGLVVAVESMVGIMGWRQAERGLAPGEDWIVLTTADAGGGTRDSVVAGVEHEGHLYVAANHWPRGWYRRALRQPELTVTRGGQAAPYRAVSVTGDERDRIARAYDLPVPIRFMTGFPPRAFLRLDPR
jgi:hypothetical protein